MFLESGNADWWFVKKHLTLEKGWVPAKYLMEESNYLEYVQRKLREKIDKLPVFDGNVLYIFYIEDYSILYCFSS